MSNEFDKVLENLTKDSLVEDTTNLLDRLLKHQNYSPGNHDGLFLKGADALNDYINHVGTLIEQRGKIERLKNRLELEISLIDPQ